MAWGTTAAEAAEQQEANEGQTWIRYFKDPETRIRIAPYEAVRADGVTVYGTDAWPTTREHFKNGVGSFPCGKDNGIQDCPGCADPDSRVRERSRKYFFPALDDQGVARIFKMGPRLHKRFQNRAARTSEEALTQRDFTIIKSGTGKETDYDPEAGDQYEIDFGELEFPDIQQALQDAWDNAVTAFNGGGADEGTDADPAAGDFPKDGPRTNAGHIAPAKKAAAASEGSGRIAPAAKKAAAAPKAKAEPPQDEVETKDAPAPKDAPDESGAWGPNPDDETIESADTAVIKAWLDANDVEYPARAPRARIIAIAKEAAVPF